MPIPAPPFIQVLYLEDDSDDAALTQTWLARSRARRFQVTIASRLAQGLAYLTTQSADIVLLDLHLPDSQGLETFRRLRQQFPAIPIVICSTLDDTELSLTAVQEGAQDFLIKGDFDGKLLTRTICHAIERHDLLQKVAAASQAKSEFLAVMSHELRTPLQAILGLSEVLLTSDLTVKQQDWAETIYSSGEVLLGLIDEVLDFSKIESGQMHLAVHPFNLPDCIAQAVTCVAPKAETKNLWLDHRLQAQTPTWALGDAARLQQILVNLLDNAIKFTQAGGVTLTVGVDADGAPASEHESVLKFTIQDTGIGLSPEQQKDLFQPFVQVDSSLSRQYGGAGLGLAICQRLCELMGGEIWFDSSLGKGAAFYFTIRVRSMDLPPSDRPSPTPASLIDPCLGTRHPLRLLVAEDNLVNQKVILRLLQRLGYQADVVANGVGVLEALHRQAYDVVFLDLQMPEMDGLETAQRICRQWPAPHRPRLIALTAAVLEQDRKACQSVGMDDFLGKPVGAQALAAALLACSQRHASP